MKRTLTLAALISIGLGTLAPLPSMAQNVSLVIRTAPPAPRYESIPGPRHGYVWAPGYWNWDGHRHVWLAGHWEPVRNGFAWQGAEWVRDNDGYRFRAAGWVPVVEQGYGEIRIAPPAPRFERVPAPRPGFLWEPGHWEWRGNRHEWISGVWIAERPGQVYNYATWYQRDGRWFMEPARWVPRGQDRNHDGIPDRYEHRDEHRGRDRDHDGIPDRRDHDRDNDGVPNRRDHDRDGDGVPNNRDRRPDDPRRY